MAKSHHPLETLLFTLVWEIDSPARGTFKRSETATGHFTVVYLVKSLRLRVRLKLTLS